MVTQPPLYASLLAGGAAGLIVDVTMFPLDTLKTRLQSQDGLWKTGGFQNIYRGILPAVTGSVPCAALFFCTYDTLKSSLGRDVQPEMLPFVHVLSASVAEVAACTVRVPVEIVKQRLQASSTTKSATELALNVWRVEGIRGCYRGFGSTVLREVPFSSLQFPLWEWLKQKWSVLMGRKASPTEGALCGAVAGGISAAITTPLDVAKTRIMLFDSNKVTILPNQRVPSVVETLGIVYRGQGISGLYSGLIPRVLWITIGGVVFFGVYEHTVNILTA